MPMFSGNKIPSIKKFSTYDGVNKARGGGGAAGITLDFEVGIEMITVNIHKI